MTRRWEAGMSGEMCGVLWRVVRGHKSEDDLRFEWMIDRGIWVPIPMSVVARLADFFFENEQYLYPPPRYRGGAKFWDYLRHAMKFGWQKADAGLQAEKDVKRSLFEGSA